MTLVCIMFMLSILALYYTYAGLVFSMIGLSLSVWHTFGILAATGSLCVLVRGKGRAVRLLSALPALLCFAGAKTVCDFLLPAAPVFYLALASANARWDTDYYQVRAVFTAAVKLFPAALLTGFFFGSMTYVATVAAPFYIVWIFISVLLLRSLRHNSGEKLGFRFHALNLSSLALIVATGIVMSSGRFISACKAALVALNQYIFSPLILGATYVLIGLISAVNSLIRFFSPGAGGIDVSEFSLDMSNLDVSDLTGGAAELKDTPEWLKIAFFTLCALAALLAMYLIIRKLISHRPDSPSPSGDVIRTEIEADSSRGIFASVGALSSPRERVRRCYRRFIRLCADRGIAVDERMTTENIVSQLPPELTSGPAERLRGVYLPARYNLSADIPEDSVRHARDALSELKSIMKGKN